MRAPMGPIRENPSGFETTIKMFNEIIAVMTSINAPITENVEFQLKKVSRLGYLMKSSMQRDMEKAPADAQALALAEGVEDEAHVLADAPPRASRSGPARAAGSG